MKSNAADSEIDESRTTFSRPKIVLLGVGHVFNLQEAVRTTILAKRPETVALELDAARFDALISKQWGTHRKGIPVMYKILGRFQESLAEQFGGEVGSEMVAAFNAAREIGAKVALIDMDAVKIFSRLRKSMTVKEKVSIFLGLLISFFARRSTIERELEKYRNDEEKYLGEMQKVYPSTVKVLIEDRNKYMAEKLRSISAESKNVLVVIGDGHITGISRLLSEFADIEVMRLDDLRRTSLSDKGSEFTISYYIDWENSNS